MRPLRARDGEPPDIRVCHIGSSAAVPPGRSAGPACPPAATVTPEQARQAIDLLQDDAKRAQFVQTLQTIANASSTAAPAKTALPADNLGVQLLAQVSDWFGQVSAELATAARAISDFPMIWRWLVQMTIDPVARHTLLDTAWKLALVIACAFAAEWLTRRVLRRSAAAIEHYVPARAPAGRRSSGGRLAIGRGDARPAPMAHEPCAGVACHAAAAVRSRPPGPRPRAGHLLCGGRQSFARHRYRRRGHAARGNPGDRQSPMCCAAAFSASPRCWSRHRRASRACWSCATKPRPISKCGGRASSW